MRLFDTSGADAAYDKWLNPSLIHEEDGCEEICHPYHLENLIFDKKCQFCQEAPATTPPEPFLKVKE